MRLALPKKHKQNHELRSLAFHCATSKWSYPEKSKANSRWVIPADCSSLMNCVETCTQGLF
eukprot:3709756-Amphidinium_carterae.1